jgi:hypothetical protein
MRLSEEELVAYRLLEQVVEVAKVGQDDYGRARARWSLLLSRCPGAAEAKAAGWRAISEPLCAANAWTLARMMAPLRGDSRLVRVGAESAVLWRANPPVLIENAEVVKRNGCAGRTKARMSTEEQRARKAERMAALYQKKKAAKAEGGAA